jgi:hypothetical protein
MLNFFGPYNAFGWPFGTNAGAPSAKIPLKPMKINGFPASPFSRKRSHHDTKNVPKGAGVTQNGSKITPKGPQRLPKGRQMTPKASQRTPGRTQRGRKASTMRPKGPPHGLPRLSKAPAMRPRLPRSTKKHRKRLPQGCQKEPRSAIHGSLFKIDICLPSGLSASMPACLDASWHLNGLGGCREALTMNC